MLDFDLADFGDELYWEPRRLVFPGPWTGHIPFAFWLVKVTRPRVLVELGTHTGNSYSALCQAVAAFETPTRAFAVDTWRGDEHSGLYDDEVFNELGEFNAVHYRAFSTLIRSTFDEARPYFEDGSVDVLHIDGMHTYDAVRHDFETWSDALSERAVVMFHDTNVRERDFGVWRLWKELAARYPSFEFDHSNGLGVLGVGSAPPAGLETLFELGRDADKAAAIRRRFAARGALFQEKSTGITLQRELAHLRGELRRHQEDLRLKDEQIAGTIGQHDENNRRVAEDLGMLNARLAQSERAEAQSQQHVARLGQLVEAKEALVARHESEALAGQARFQAEAQRAGELEGLVRQQAEALRLTHDAYLGSMSWRVTSPLRKASTLLRRRAPEEAAPPAPAGIPATAGVAAAAEEGGRSPSVDLKAATRSLLAQRLRSFLQSPGMLQLPSSDAPDVSIILVLYNQAELTYGCLASIVETLSAGPLAVEVVILDNGSSDATDRLLQRVQGATIIRSAENLHFLRGVNRAAEAARGRHILFLNNDAQLTAGSLVIAAGILDAEPEVGAVGGRLILPDGTLQEAGSIVWSDGTCAGYGRGREADSSAFMFRRDVDYCSGAFLLTRRDAFERLGRFDEAYAPAYYEETDYCLRLWEDGLRVVFDPRIVTLHFEFGSSAEAADALALQRRNHGLFRRRHAGWLAGQHAPAKGNALFARHAGTPGKRILVLEDRVPKPELGSGYPRANDILAELDAQGAAVTLYPMFEHAERWDDVRRSIPVSVEVVLEGSADRLAGFLAERRGFYDAILVCRPHNMVAFRKALAADPGVAGGARIIYDAEAVFARRRALMDRVLGKPVDEAEAGRLVAEELALADGADMVLSVSAAESRLFAGHGVGNVRLLGHRLEAEPTGTPFEERGDVLFLGAMHDEASPNADSLRWFSGEVLPALRAELGRDLRLKVVGLNKAPSIEALDGTTLDLTGQVDDLKPHFETARVVVIPTRFAAGIPHKAHHAASFGVPIVGTDLIADQLGWTAGQDLLARSDPTGFAKACAELYTDAALWASVRANALARLEADCSPATFRAAIADVLAFVPKGGRTPPGAEAATPAAEPGHVGRPIAEDFAAAVPFGYIPAPPEKAPRIAAIIHVFYEDLAGEILGYVANLPAGSDVYVSTDTEGKKAAIEAVFAAYRGGAVTVRVVPNRGRDIAPKLVGFRDVYASYDYVLHLHSKASVHDKFLAPWRTFLFENLLGSPAVVGSILEAFERGPRLGMIFPQHYDYIRRWLDWGGNYREAEKLAGRLGVTLFPDQALDFPSGSMFWARSAALKPLLDLGLDFDDFPAEGRQTDGTLAHVIERLYAIACEAAGYDWIKIARPELLLDSRSVVFIADEAALSEFIRTRTVAITGPEAIPTLAEPPAMVARLPQELTRLARRQGQPA